MHVVCLQGTSYGHIRSRSNGHLSTAEQGRPWHLLCRGTRVLKLLTQTNPGVLVTVALPFPHDLTCSFPRSADPESNATMCVLSVVETRGA